jgi:hypothetical protein
VECSPTPNWVKPTTGQKVPALSKNCRALGPALGTDVGTDLATRNLRYGEGGDAGSQVSVGASSSAHGLRGETEMFADVREQLCWCDVDRKLLEETMSRLSIQSRGALKRAMAIVPHGPLPSPRDRLAIRLRSELKVHKSLPFQFHRHLLHLERALAHQEPPGFKEDPSSSTARMREA